MIFVTGMHRSGTSAVSQLMRSWGVDFGAEDRFLAADRWNERGYLEVCDVLDLNSRMITGFQRSRRGLSRLIGQAVYLSMPSPAVIDRRAARLVGPLGEIFSEYRGKAVKDPRFCLTLNHWHRDDVAVKVVACLRSPSAVAASLHRRQRLPESLGLRFWDWHWRSFIQQLEATPAAEPGKRSVHWVRFDRLRGPEAVNECARLARFLELPLAEDALEESLAKVFSAKLVHFDNPATALPRAVEVRWRDLLAHADAQ